MKSPIYFQVDALLQLVIQVLSELGDKVVIEAFIKKLEELNGNKHQS
jgi:hypothetical protein